MIPIDGHETRSGLPCSYAADATVAGWRAYNIEVISRLAFPNQGCVTRLRDETMSDLKIGDVVVDWDGDRAEILKLYRVGDAEHAVLFYSNGSRGSGNGPFSHDIQVTHLEWAAQRRAAAEARMESGD
jgi:hypothetical protein